MAASEQRHSGTSLENSEENPQASTSNGDTNYHTTSYGSLVENLSTLQLNLPSNTERQENRTNLIEIEKTPSSPQVDPHLKFLNSDRSYSIENVKVLSDKYGSTENVNYETLDTLPPELFLHICSFLDAKFVIEVLASVCRYFDVLLGDDTFWKIRMGKKWKNKYPPIPVRDCDFNWAKACIAREEQYRLWTDYKNNMDFYQYKEDLFAAVDVVHLMKNGQLLAAGSRDRYLTLLDVTKLNPNDPQQSVKQCKIMSKINAHKGWIWSLSSWNDTLLTGSWDTYVKFWDLAADGKEVSKIKCSSAVLCTHFEENYAVAGSYDKKVYHLDPRTSQLTARKSYHTRPVLCMAVDNSYIITGSEDQKVVIYDRRAGKVFKTIKLESSYAMSLSYGMDQLWLGTKSGDLQLVDASDGDFDLIGKYDGIHEGKITGVIHGLGGIFTSSTDRTIKVLQPSLNPLPFAVVAEHSAEIAKIAFQNGVLASASSDVSIGIWLPKQ